MLSKWPRLQRAGQHAQVVDPGLQAERTAISWQRTALSVGAFSVLLLHTGGARLGTRVPGALALLVSLLLLLVAERRYVDMLININRQSTPSSPQALRRVSLAVVFIALLSLGVILAS